MKHYVRSHIALYIALCQHKSSSQKKFFKITSRSFPHWISYNSCIILMFTNSHFYCLKTISTFWILSCFVTFKLQRISINNIHKIVWGNFENRWKKRCNKCESIPSLWLVSMIPALVEPLEKIYNWFQEFIIDKSPRYPHPSLSN